MRFTESIITTQGQELLARAVQGGTIIWGTAQCASDTADASTTEFAQVVASGTVAANNRTGQDVTLVAYISNSGLQGGRVNSFGIFGKLEGDAEEVLAIVCNADPAVPSTFPAHDGTDETLLTTIIALGLTLSDNVISNISVETGLYAMQSDLAEETNARQTLASRVVTTHAEGSATTGEAQTIYGEKKFKMIKVSNIQPEPGGYFSIIGHETNEYLNAYIKELRPGTDGTGSVGKSYAAYGNGYIDTIKTGTLEAKNGASIETKANIIPEDQSEVTIGAMLAPFKAVYTYDVVAGIAVTTAKVKTNAIEPMTAGGSSIETKATIIPASQSQATIGAQATPFKDVYADKLHGILPTESNGNIAPGCITMVYVVANTLQTGLGLGSEFKAGTGAVTAVYSVQIGRGVVAPFEQVAYNNNKFVALTSSQANHNTTTNRYEMFVMAMCIE